jgi:Chlorophyll A-B binding protein
MKFSPVAIVSAVAMMAGSASAFAPSVTRSTTSALRMSEVEEAVTADVNDAPSVPAVAPINGWVPDASKPCYGLPGAIAPLGYFDPLGFCKDRELGGVKRFREAEIMHGRVAMMATVGYLIGENTPTIAYGMTVPSPTIGNDQIPEVPGLVLFSFFLLINIAEALRANIGWVEPGLGALFTLREKYYPGDVGFDPLGLKPTSADEFANMQAKELSNGRLAMFAAMGMMVQELVTKQNVLSWLN